MMAPSVHHPQDRLEVLPGVFLDEIDTLVRCDEVLNQLMTSVPDIESQIEFAERGLSDTAKRDPTWLPRARKALRTRKLRLPPMQQLRSKLVKDAKAAAHAASMGASLSNQQTADRVFVKVVWEIAPEIAERARTIAMQRSPEHFEAGPCLPIRP